MLMLGAQVGLSGLGIITSSNFVQRRRGFERPKANSTRKGSVKLVSNMKISPASTEPFYGAKLIIAGEESRGSSSKPSNDDGTESTESASKDDGSVADGVDEKRFKKMPGWRKSGRIAAANLRWGSKSCHKPEARPRLQPELPQDRWAWIFAWYRSR